VAIIVAGCLMTGCGSSVKSAIGSATSRAATAVSSATSGATPTATPTPTPTPTETATPTETTTVTATATATAATSTATSPAASSPSAAASGDSGTSLLWLWILLGVLILAGLITWIARSGRRRSATAADWQSRIIDAYAKGAALHDAMGVAEAQKDALTSLELAEELRHELGLVEHDLGTAAITGLGGDRLATHAVPSGRR